MELKQPTLCMYTTRRELNWIQQINTAPKIPHRKTFHLFLLQVSPVSSVCSVCTDGARWHQVTTSQRAPLVTGRFTPLHAWWKWGCMHYTVAAVPDFMARANYWSFTSNPFPDVPPTRPACMDPYTILGNDTHFAHLQNQTCPPGHYLHLAALIASSNISPLPDIRIRVHARSFVLKTSNPASARLEAV